MCARASAKAPSPAQKKVPFSVSWPPWNGQRMDLQRPSVIMGKTRRLSLCFVASQPCNLRFLSEP